MKGRHAGSRMTSKPLSSRMKEFTLFCQHGVIKAPQEGLVLLAAGEWQESSGMPHSAPALQGSCSGSGVSIRRDSPLLTLAQHPMGPGWQGLGGLSAVYEKTKQMGRSYKNIREEVACKTKDRLEVKGIITTLAQAPPAFPTCLLPYL